MEGSTKRTWIWLCDLLKSTMEGEKGETMWRKGSCMGRRAEAFKAHKDTENTSRL